MSGFNVFQKMSRRMEEGWKLTNASCPICQTSILGHPTTKELFCVKCEMPVKIESDEVEDTEVEVVGNSNTSSGDKKNTEFDDYENMVFARENDPRRKKADELSKKMGDYLLQGWAMLEESCMDCLFPYMKSRKGEIICVGCGPVDKKKENEKVVAAPIIDTKRQSSPEIIKKEDIKESKPLKKEAPQQVQHVVPEKKKDQLDVVRKELTGPVFETNLQNDAFEIGRFDESIGLYTRITQRLTEDFEKFAEQGLIYNLDKVEKILDIQKKIDSAKLEILSKFTKQE